MSIFSKVKDVVAGYNYANSNPVASFIRSFASNIVPFGNLIDNGIGLISGISNNIYDRQLQERLFERDDTSLDRTMEMYKRNGLNPLLALPNANAGNTRGPEPANISSDFNQSILNSFQRKQMKLAEQKMYLENAIAREDLNDKKLTNAMNRQLLQGDINANWVNWKDYYSDQDKYKDVPYKNGGVRSLPGTEKEHLVRYILNLLGLTSESDDGSSTSTSSPKPKGDFFKIKTTGNLREQAQIMVQTPDSGLRQKYKTNTEKYIYTPYKGFEYEVEISPRGYLKCNGKKFDTWNDFYNYVSEDMRDN